MGGHGLTVGRGQHGLRGWGAGWLNPFGRGGGALTHAIVHACTHARGRGTTLSLCWAPTHGYGVRAPQQHRGQGSTEGRDPHCPQQYPVAPIAHPLPPCGIWDLGSGGRIPPECRSPLGRGPPISVLPPPPPQPGAPPARRAHALRPPEELGDGEHRLRHAVRPGRAGGAGTGGVGRPVGLGAGCPTDASPTDARRRFRARRAAAWAPWCCPSSCPCPALRAAAAVLSCWLWRGTSSTNTTRPSGGECRLPAPLRPIALPHGAAAARHRGIPSP